MEEEFDYVIIGGGVAGCVLANRLSADPANRVLVLEAGTDGDSDMRIRVPAGLIKIFKSERDWNFETTSDDAVGGGVYLCRGKVLGGSSCTNVQLYHRGSAEDYREWEVAGAAGWGPEAVLPYFRRSESYCEGESQYHGGAGPIPVTDVPYMNELSKAFLKACGEFGFRRNNDFNDWATPQEGFGRFKVTQRNGERASASNTYLKSARSRPNLQVRTSVHVTKLLLERRAGAGLQAQGAAYTTADGEQKQALIAAHGEVLLCAGAVQSPQLLLLSGVGPREHLQQVGVEVELDVPGVGEGLQDHPAVLVSYSCPKPICLTDEIKLCGTSLTNPVALAKWLFYGKGPLTTVSCEHGGFFHTSVDKAQPDLQLRFVAARALSPDGIKTLEEFGAGAKMKSGFTVQVVACRPETRGRVRLASSDPQAKPRLEGLYVSGAGAAADLRTLREGIKLGRRICETRAFDDYRGAEVFPDDSVRSDAALEEYVRSTIHSANALVGSCRIGAAGDPAAVLDPQLRLRGIASLRVCDASAMPAITGGQTCAPTYMIAERAAEFVLQDRAASIFAAEAAPAAEHMDTAKEVAAEAEELVEEVEELASQAEEAEKYRTEESELEDEAQGAALAA